MKTVDVNYRRFFRNRSLHIPVPERWEDLKPYQFAICARFHIDPPTDEEFVHEFFRFPKKVVSKLSKFELYKLTELVGFISSPNASVSRFYLSEIPGTGLKSPSGRLGNVSLEQFALLDTYFFKYANQPDDLNLCEFVAAVYLKQYEVLTDIDFTKRVDYIQRNVDKPTLYAIYLNYIFIRKWLSRSFRFLFEVTEDEDSPRRNFKKPSIKTNDLPEWVAIIDNMVGDDILNYDQYTAMNCIRAFKLINNRIKNYRKNAR